MNKSEVTVKINSAEEAEQAKQTLLALGETLQSDYWIDGWEHSQDYLRYSLRGWAVAALEPSKTVITLRELILILSHVATPQVEEPLKLVEGKTLIHVNGKEEFDLLMQHYKSKGWSLYGGLSPENYDIEEAFEYGANLVQYSDLAVFPSHSVVEAYNHANTIFDPDFYDNTLEFAEFAKIVSIENRVPILTSEDGVDLYAGDKMFEVAFSDFNQEWYLVNAQSGVGYWTLKEGIDYRVVRYAIEYKAFSTKEAAEAWIEETNSPKLITVTGHGAYNVDVEADCITVLCADKDMHKDNIVIYPAELEEIWDAYQKVKA